MSYLAAFLVGGFLCALAQVILDFSKMTPGHVMVLFVVLGGIATSIDVYQKLIDFGGAGATIPLPGFGSSLVKGALDGIKESGVIGLFKGCLEATAMGLSAAVFFGFIAAAVFNPRS